MSKPAFVGMCVAAGLPAPVPEFRFHPTRKWRFDFAWPDVPILIMRGNSGGFCCRLAMEIDGAVWKQGRHTRGAGYIADMEKLNAAAMAGWLVLRYTPDQILSKAIPDLQTAML